MHSLETIHKNLNFDYFQGQQNTTQYDSVTGLKKQASAATWPHGHKGKQLTLYNVLCCSTTMFRKSNILNAFLIYDIFIWTHLYKLFWRLNKIYIVPRIF